MNMMKKYLFMLAAFVAATATFTACSSEEDAVSSAEQEEGVVKTEFTISFPKQMGSMTRQSEKVVQGQSTPIFRGIQNIELLPFHLAPTAISGSTPFPTKINLQGGTSSYGFTGPSALSANTIASSGALYETSKSHLYKDIEIAIGTRSFIFYGLAIPETTIPEGVESAGVNGALTQAENPSTLGDVTFSLSQIYSSGIVSQQASDIATYLTGIANAKVGSETTLTLFPNFKNINTGSWNSVKAAVQQVYSAIYNQIATGNLQEAIATAITKTYTIGEGDGARSVQFVTGVGTDGKLTFSTAYTYPKNIYLPDGAAYVTWDTDHFNALTNDNMGQNIGALDTYVYPASLYYFGLSGIKTASAPMSSYYTSTATWKNIVDAYDGESVQGKGTVVSSTTQSIAIEKEVQYAVGRLDVTVNTDEGHNYLQDGDNKIIDGIIAGSPATATDPEVAPTFPITGIIVANQRPVDYKFEPKGTSTYVIYDSQVTENLPCLYPGVKNAYPQTRKTHTLVLQTPDAGTSEDAKVKIAVEFLNNSGKTIVGKDGVVIYPNTKFYLIGELDPGLNTTQAYSTGPDSPIIKKAFVQDYVTTANFVVKTFKSAYNMLPDLRSPKLEIGMSVDLTWRPGITQEIIIP